MEGIGKAADATVNALIVNDVQDKQVGKRIGRPKGSKNKLTARREAAIARSGILPLDYMLRIMRDETADKAARERMAVAAAPYVHPKLQAVELGNKGGEPLKVMIAARVAQL